MWVLLDPDEAQFMAKVVRAAQAERAWSISRAETREETARLEEEARRLEAILARLSEAHREEVLDESLEESFPASDPPARSVVSER